MPLFFSNSVSIHFSIIFYCPKLKLSSMNLNSYFVFSSPKIYFISINILPFYLISAGFGFTTLKKDSFWDNSNFYSFFSVFCSYSFFTSYTLASDDSYFFSPSDCFSISRELLIQLLTCSLSLLNLLLILRRASLSSGSNYIFPFALMIFNSYLTSASGFSLTTSSNSC